jgi:hypothetical protein
VISLQLAADEAVVLFEQVAPRQPPAATAATPAPVPQLAAAEARGGQLVRANIGDSDPTQHFIDHVLPQLAKLRSTYAGVDS